MCPEQKKVLIVEDEIDAAEMFAEMMRVSGYAVMKSYSSAPAMDMISSEKPDLIILDVMMPDVSGLDILRAMRQKPEMADIPVVVVSAKSMPSDIREGMEAGASVYLTKPVGFTELRRAVEQAVGKAG